MALDLSKWYLDCVTATGESVIAYIAELRWHRVRLRYSALLVGSSARSAHGGRDPAGDGGEIEWSSDALDVSGRWHALDPPIECTVFEGDEGFVRWRCLQPRAHATVRVGTRELEGFGYAEHVHLTVAPWRLPIQRLRWGRFLHPDGYVVWIEWDGRQFRWASPEGEIEFLDRRMLREGTLGSTALSAIPGVNRTLPARVLNIHETKWLSRAKLRRPGHPDTEGQAIHEVVKWPAE